MLFSSISFIYYFLPIALIGSIYIPKRFKNIALILASCIFYAWNGISSLFIFLSLLILSYIEACWLVKYKKPTLFTSFCLIHIFLMIYFKSTMNILGISFFTLQILSYMIDLYQDTIQHTSLVHYLTYMTFFGHVLQGPIVRYQEIQNELTSRTPDIFQGIERFVLGLSKKVLLADVLYGLCQSFETTNEASMIYMWLYLIAYILRLYYDFSGYSDMAIGLGKMFGFHLPENFQYPLTSRTLQDFWRRWHMSLGRWFKDYIYIPLGGNRNRWIRNLGIVWFLTSLWHGLSLPYLFWGLWMWIGLILEKKLKIKNRFYTWFILLISFVFFSSPDVSIAWARFSILIGIQVPLLTQETISMFLTYGPVIFLALFGIRKWKFPNWIYLPLFILCTAFMIHSSYMPFLYFQF